MTKQWLILPVLLASLPAAFARPETEELLERLERLEERVSILESRLFSTPEEAPAAHIETQDGSSRTNPRTQHPAPAQVAPKAAWQVKSKWEQLENGMSIEQTEKILGAPVYSVKALKPRIDRVSYYAPGIREIHEPSSGLLEFYKGRLVNFRAPNLW